MDSLTHAALGACLGEIMLSRKLGKRALLWGAVAQNLPDIDVVAALWLPPSENVLVHRGGTHSFLFALVAAALLAFLARKWYKDRQIPWGQFFLFFTVQLFVHDLLDTCNAYGTGLLEPFSHERFSFHLLYVADPLFTLWPCLGLIALLMQKITKPARWRWALAGLIPAGLYLIFAMYNQSKVSNQIEASLTRQQLSHTRYFVTPTPFNTLLWYAVAATDEGYYVGHRSVLAPKEMATKFTYFPRNQHLLTSAVSKEEVQELIRVAKGYHTVERWNDTLVFNVLRYGQILGWQNPRGKFTFHYFLSPPGVDNKQVMQRGRVKGWTRETIDNMFRAIFVKPEEEAGATSK
ncbi:metal-dependent hydrolase [Rufibacter latericius]|uniref:Metal-dependent hydrolase n=1 Tax=Rufibacter latericius TaxID=2487040 RepID=A0A3M9MQI8_9BACT|nr:metal-dependent hydrolase [Rufibacter latericius]RNI26968.1 metal-dependent hydrolase [Rufibacter latericius]